MVFCSELVVEVVKKHFDMPVNHTNGQFVALHLSEMHLFRNGLKRRSSFENGTLPSTHDQISQMDQSISLR
jgi:hypothetical protein